MLPALNRWAIEYIEGITRNQLIAALNAKQKVCVLCSSKLKAAERLSLPGASGLTGVRLCLG